ncbi:MAG: hypothetical protein ACMUJM_25800 [bacterium]
MDIYQNSHDGFSCTYRKPRSKSDWAGISIGDAFKSNIEYYLRLQAQREFYQMVKKTQLALARQAGCIDPGPPRIKPQLSPLYTHYPSILSAYAAIGLSGYLEFEARVNERLLLRHLAGYLQNPAIYDKVKIEPNVYKQMAMIVARNVQTRLLLEDLSRVPDATSIELYRLFSASQQSIKFSSVPEIIKAVILYGDIIPDWQKQKLHPLTLSILKDINAVCIPFFDRLPYTKEYKMIMSLGTEWVRSVCICLAKYLPEPEINNEQKPSQDLKTQGTPTGDSAKDKKYGFKGPSEQQVLQDIISPLNGPHPPSLFDNMNAAIRALNNMLNKISSRQDGKLEQSNFNKICNGPRKQILEEFIRTIDRASSQQRRWEDLRSDILEGTLRVSDFSQSPIQGNPADGHAVTIHLGKDLAATGEIFDRAIELSDDLPAYEKLLSDSKSITEALQRTLYPNLEHVPETLRFCPSGSLDPGRLATADISSAIFRRYRINEKADRRGRPLLLIACDGSGSLKENQIRMLKVLTAAWLNSTTKSCIQIIAGLYHSGQIRAGLSGPLVEWIYHPHKTPATSRKDAARALISLPKSGTGAQSDALSLAFILDEAYRIAQGKMVYLILITDCMWNRTSPIEKSGKDEVYSYFRKAYERFTKRLHTTLVALGVSGKTGFEDIVEKVITVSGEDLGDYNKIANKISLYVASCMKERHRWLTRH